MAKRQLANSPYKSLIFDGFWRRTQAPSNRSPTSDSLLTGKNTGKSVESATLNEGSTPLSPQIQRLDVSIPYEKNSELSRGIRERYAAKQGT